MNFDYRDTIPADFHDTSRVWVYQASRLFTIPEALQIEVILKDFTSNWQSHGTPVKGYANLLFGQFIILMADETATGVSGCSTDSSVRVIKNIEEQFGVNLFDRQMLAFFVKDKVQLLPFGQLNYALENNYITPSTLYFNNLVANKKEFTEKWIIPVKDSWLSTRIKLEKAN
ncbi:hypothetical protein I5907_16495 [Panacibacter sp. DH6]|uniref:ABC transporter ATPase n=1 Tax=Panacibacter microcysteis TaxID=2793269 RepID=A0A931E9J0_9BACT|nr:hypothetical protein [Panacibacter microcysteis]MBG9377841.1 hypothetical protein [Panacibacter microcysteis]